MSQIATIYAALAAAAVTVSGTTPTVYAGSSLRDSVESAELPVRVLSPFGTGLSGSGSVFASADGNQVATWTIRDLLLWRKNAEGIGLEDIADTLIAYCGAYADMLPALRSTKWRLTAWQATPSAINWPQGAATWYDGVSVTLTFRELLA